MQYEYVGKEALKSFWNKVVTLVDLKMTQAGATGISFDQVYPVGSVILTTDSTDPTYKFGGTWVQISQGRCIVGVGTGTDKNGNPQDFAPRNNSIGEYTHAITTEELPAHSHDYAHTHTTNNPNTTATTSSAGAHEHTSKYRENCSGSGSYDLAYPWGDKTDSGELINSAGAHTHTVSLSHTHTTNSQSSTTTGETGSGTSVNVVQPSFGVYIWERTL